MAAIFASGTITQANKLSLFQGSLMNYNFITLINGIVHAVSSFD